MGYRSFLALLIENQPRYSDGLLPMIASSNLLDETLSLLQELGKPEFDNNRTLFTDGVKKFLAEVKLNSEIPSPNQYDIENTIDSLYQKLSDYPDMRSENLSTEDWEDITNLAELGWKILSKNSEYNLSSKIEFLLRIIQDIKIQPEEISAMFNLLQGILMNDDTSQSYRITHLLTNNLPYLILHTSMHSRSLVGIFAGISKSYGFGSYFMMNLKKSFHTRDILYDLEKFLFSNEIQSYAPHEEAILIQIGSLLRVLADIKEQGKKTGGGGYTFEDKWNQFEPPDTYFDFISYILTK